MYPDETSEPGSSGLSLRACRLLTGLDVGLGGAVAVLVWLLFHSWVRGEFWWAKFNVAGAPFYGSAVYSMGLGRATLAGFALLFVMYSLLGVVFGLFAQSRGLARNFILALFWVLGWHIFAQRYFWRSLDPFGASYFPLLATLPGHLLACFCLARFAVRFQSIARTFGDPVWASEFQPQKDLAPAADSIELVEDPETAAAISAVPVEDSGQVSSPGGTGSDQDTSRGVRTDDC